MGALLEKGFDALMAQQRVPDLARWAFVEALGVT